jgi:hypothetical protein
MGNKDMDLVPKGRHLGIQFLVMGGGMLIWLQGQGPLSKQMVVERKEIIALVDMKQNK